MPCISAYIRYYRKQGDNYAMYLYRHSAYWGTMPFIRTKIRDGKKYRYLVENYWDKEKKSSRQRVIQYLGVDIGEGGSEKLVSPSHKMDKIERAIPVGKFALYYVSAQYIDLREVLEKHCPSQSFPHLALVMNQVCNRLSLEKAAAWANITPLAEWEGSKQTKKSSVLRRYKNNVLRRQMQLFGERL
jgi:hypothetical protein